MNNSPKICGNNPKWCENCVSKGKCASTRPQATNNAELFKQTFGIYATELWTMTNADFMKWLNAEVQINNDLISREALKRVLETYRPNPINPSKLNDYAQGKNNMIDYCIAEIDSAPAIEEVPNNMTLIPTAVLDELTSITAGGLGRWKVDGALIACDSCGQILLKASKLYRYCPNCGALMVNAVNIETE